MVEYVSCVYSKLLHRYMSTNETILPEPLKSLFSLIQPASKLFVVEIRWFFACAAREKPPDLLMKRRRRDFISYIACKQALCCGDQAGFRVCSTRKPA